MEKNLNITKSCYSKCILYQWRCSLIRRGSTVVHGTTYIQWNPAIQPPRYYDNFFVAQTKAHSFSYLKTPLIRPPRYYDQRPPLGVLRRYFLYKITPLIRPVKMLGGAAC